MSSYAHVHRSNTSKRPFISLDPVSFSLTEGTNIPAPPPIKEEEEKKDEPSPLNSARTATSASNRKSANRISQINTDTDAGPLSSHPVTPIDSANDQPSSKGFPFNPSDPTASPVNGSTSAPPFSPSKGVPTRKPVPQRGPSGSGTHPSVSEGSVPASSSQRAPVPRWQAPGDAEVKQQRRQSSSIFSRFLRFRSSSSMRGNEGQNQRGSPYQNGGDVNNSGVRRTDYGYAYGSPEASSRPSADPQGANRARGVKRPASSSMGSMLDYGSHVNNANIPPPSRGGDQQRGRSASMSLPRLMRKKSMEWFGTSRRKSGAWDRSTTPDPSDPLNNGRASPGASQTMLAGDSAMADEARREQMMAEYYGNSSNAAASTRNGYHSSAASTRDGHRMSFASTMNESTSDPVERYNSRVPVRHREPPPMLPDVKEEGSLDGDALFGSIGRA